MRFEDLKAGGQGLYKRRFDEWCNVWKFCMTINHDAQKHIA